MNSTYGVNFKPEPPPQGLKYLLEGWSGPVGIGTRTYEVREKFGIPWPREPYVTIVDANNYPNGQWVLITFIPKGADGGKPSETVKPSETDEPADDSQEGLTVEDEPLTEFLQQPFKIRERYDLPPGGAVRMDFDENMDYNKDIAWTLKPIRIGETQVRVLILGGVVINYRIRKVCDITTYPRDLIKSDPSFDELPLSFPGNVNIAARRVRERYLEAELYEVEAKPPTPEIVTSPTALTKLKMVFRAGKGNAWIESDKQPSPPSTRSPSSKES